MMTATTTTTTKKKKEIRFSIQAKLMKNDVLDVRMKIKRRIW